MSHIEACSTCDFQVTMLKECGSCCACMANYSGMASTWETFCHLGTLTAKHCDEILVGQFYNDGGVANAHIGLQLQIIVISLIFLLFVK